jgi:hypothetical protein
MDKVFGEECAEIAADGSWGRLGWVGSAHHGANNFPCVFGTFNGHGNDWTARHELNEFSVEAFTDMLFVVALKDGLIKGTKFHTHKAKTLVFESGGDGAHEATFNGIGLEEDEGAI